MNKKLAIFLLALVLTHSPSNSSVVEINENAKVIENKAIPQVEKKESIFDGYFKFYLKMEGGYAEFEPAYGGATNKGLTYSTYLLTCRDALEKNPSFTHFKNIETKDVKTIIKKYFWDINNLEALNNKYLAFQFSDFFVTSGNSAITALNFILQDEGVINNEFYLNEELVERLNKNPLLSAKIARRLFLFKLYFYGQIKYSSALKVRTIAINDYVADSLDLKTFDYSIYHRNPVDKIVDPINRAKEDEFVFLQEEYREFLETV